MEPSNMEPATLTTLPPEVLKLIMACFDDINDLLQIVCSCRAIYSIYQSCPHLLIAPLVQQRIHPSLLPQVIETIKARERHRNSLPPAPECPDVVAEIMGQPSGAESPDFEWNFARGRAALELHQVVEAFTRDLQTSFLYRFSGLNSGQGFRYASADPITESELVRMQRAAYRFEIYTYLFPINHNGTPDKTTEAQTSFFSHLYPWENEQLASIHEKLWEKAVVAYNELAAYDISWGVQQVPIVGQPDDPAVEPILAQGLRKNLKIYQARRGYHPRRKALEWYTPTPGKEFLRRPLSTYMSQLVARVRQSSQDSRGPAASETHKQPMYGPAHKSPVDRDARACWRWLYERNGVAPLPWADFKAMRDAGYIFFDKDRLLNSSMRPPMFPGYHLVAFDPRDSMPGPQQLADSWKLRRELYERGIRGHMGKSYPVVRAGLRNPSQLVLYPQQ